ncbi:MAG: chromosome segregation protein SMC, partial [Planctomycetaceae bacterium]|nr:chromosome segregation protein SMC [Planctomycetaceae bacterium]
NRNTARLKDIRELFMGTGAGSAAYCIIEQGRVDQILQANAASRRMIFEEAAGISRFKSRKAEALRKLERVDQNLLRLTDIVDEVESRLNSLRSQASKATKYREISTELKKLWWGLAADDYKFRSAALEELDTEIATCTERLETVNAEHQQLEDQLSGLDVQIAEVDDELRTVEKASSARRETLAAHESTVRFQTARLKELEGELARLRKQRTVMSSRATEVVLEMEHVQGQVEHFAKEFKERQEQLQKHITEIKTLNKRIEQERTDVDDKREQLLEQMREVSAAGTLVSGLNKQLQIGADSKTNVMNRRDLLEKSIGTCRSECELRRGRLEDSGEQVVHMGDHIQAIHTRRRQVLEERHEHLQALSDLREQRSAWKARKSVLEDLERRQQGLGIGVREILHRAETNPEPPWNQIQGSVADLLKVELEHAALLEVALGSRAQIIVLNEMESLVRYLKSGTYEISGRVGFMAHSGDANHPDLDTFQIVPDSIVDLSGQPGVECRADQLVHSCEVLPELPSRLLADTWIVETLDVALELSKEAGRG